MSRTYWNFDAISSSDSDYWGWVTIGSAQNFIFFIFVNVIPFAILISAANFESDIGCVILNIILISAYNTAYNNVPYYYIEIILTSNIKSISSVFIGWSNLWSHWGSLWETWNIFLVIFSRWHKGKDGGNIEKTVFFSGFSSCCNFDFFIADSEGDRRWFWVYIEDIAVGDISFFNWENGSVDINTFTAFKLGFNCF